MAWADADAVPEDARPVTPVEALGLLYGGTVPARRVPLGVIGPRDAGEAERRVAAQLGRRLGELRIPLLTGGGEGVMEAVSRGCLEAGGLPIALLPGENWRDANQGVAVPLATGLGSARNALIARASLALVAVGGGYGTLSEIAFALHFGRPVFGLESPPFVEGIRPCADVDDVLERVAAVCLGLG